MGPTVCPFVVDILNTKAEILLAHCMPETQRLTVRSQGHFECISIETVILWAFFGDTKGTKKSILGIVPILDPKEMQEN